MTCQSQISHPPRAPVRAAAIRAFRTSLRAGVADYDRDRDLPRLIGINPFAPVPVGAPELQAILARLARALRAERHKARAGHWTYDLNRHIALRQAHRAESERLRLLFPGVSANPRDSGAQNRTSVNSVSKEKIGSRQTDDQTR